MKRRISLYASIVFIVIAFGGVWFFFTLQNKESLQVFPATIQHDCAPWDGSAFTVSVPIARSVIEISIYQSPDVQRPVTFSFPGQAGQVGNALLVWPAHEPEELTGKVSFLRVEPGMPVEGEFNLFTETGEQFEGRFRAEWDEQPVYCG